MLKEFAPLSALLALFFADPALANEIELDWDSVELGFFENVDDAGAVKNGLVVYVPGSRIATTEDFYAVIPEFCDSRLEGMLEFAKQIEDAPEVSFLKLQIDFYGPKIGENETYVGRAATIDLKDGKCSF